ncbi:hypothetical protein Pint_04589 [Pistacia integerrima]|uniref:Uncharacterized protein n=1 Tax=Pistacia integerrima TaxID=434235 RepID=A0ACC0Z3Q5_9ROSI|nr:hypothetical protein Pint_04589 [Pistacia integerrima]
MSIFLLATIAINHNFVSNELMICLDDQLNEMLEEKAAPFIQNIDKIVLSQPILMQSQNKNQRAFAKFHCFYIPRDTLGSMP